MISFCIGSHQDEKSCAPGNITSLPKERKSFLHFFSLFCIHFCKNIDNNHFPCVIAQVDVDVIAKLCLLNNPQFQTI